VLSLASISSSIIGVAGPAWRVGMRTMRQLAPRTAFSCNALNSP
jgi:hypothetical protein